MIVDQLSNSHRYLSIHQGFAEAFEFLRNFNSDNFEYRRLPVNGTALMAIIEESGGRGHGGSRLEAHRNYIDIQFAVTGRDEIGWSPHSECRSVTQPYSQEQDVEFYSDTPSLWIPVPAGTFAIFFPEDAHAPLSGSELIRKIIMKVSLN